MLLDNHHHHHHHLNHLNPNSANSYSHLQRSIDTLRSLGDRLGERNVDLRLNLHHQPGGHHSHHNQQQQGLLNNIMDRGSGGAGAGGGLELNLSLNPADRLLQERMQQEQRNLERLIQERTGGLQHSNNNNQEQQEQQQRSSSNSNNNNNSMGLDSRGLEHHLAVERLSLGQQQQQHSPPPIQNDSRALMDGRSLNSSSERNMNNNNNNMDSTNNSSRLGGNNSSYSQQNNNNNAGSGSVGGALDINDLKYREYKAHLENLRSESSRSIDGGGGGGGRQDEDRGATPSTPPTPISVVENFPEEKVFGSKAELQLHTQAHMREAKPYKCSQCCKAFANSSYLSQHTRIHLGIKPYRCEICQRKFTQLSHLQQHIRTHTGDKPYKCRHPGCQKAFSQLSNLQSHSRCHQTDKPYKCNSCYKCFSDEPSLLEHIPKHKESKHLKTHICQYCGKSYTQETYLSKHMQKHAERTDKRPPIGPGLGLNHRGLDHPYWPKVSPDSAAAAENSMHHPGGGGGGHGPPHGHGGGDYPNDIPRQILEQNEDLVIIRQQLSQNHHPPSGAPPGTPSGTPNLGANAYDTASISKSNTNSAFTPINSMSGHLNLNHHQLAPNRPYIYDAISFQKQNSLDLPKSSQPSNGFPNQLISLHQIRNYAHQPNSSSLMEHSILGLNKDK